jgi:Na+-driven multidrug efflux pump
MILPILLSEFLWSLGQNVESAVYGHLGTANLAAYTLTCPIQSLIVGALSGLSAAAGVMVGKQLGKKAFDDAYRDARRIMLTGLVGAIGVASLLVLFAGAYTGLYRVDADVQALGKVLLVVFALYAPVKVENMILSGGILRSGGNTRVIMIIDTIGTWGIGIPLCLLAAYGLHWGIVGVYALLTTEEIFRLAVSLVIFKRRSWMISL